MFTYLVQVCKLVNAYITPIELNPSTEHNNRFTETILSVTIITILLVTVLIVVCVLTITIYACCRKWKNRIKEHIYGKFPNIKIVIILLLFVLSFRSKCCSRLKFKPQETR